MNSVREVEPWREARLTCGIGHTSRGRVRVVQEWVRRGVHADSDMGWSDPRQEFDPKTCLVCGLLTWKAEDSETRDSPPRKG